MNNKKANIFSTWFKQKFLKIVFKIIDILEFLIIKYKNIIDTINLYNILIQK